MPRGLEVCKAYQSCSLEEKGVIDRMELRLPSIFCYRTCYQVYVTEDIEDDYSDLAINRRLGALVVKL